MSPEPAFGSPDDAVTPSSVRKPAQPSAAPDTRVATFSAIVIGGFVAAVVVLYAFAWLADQVLDQETQSLDLAALAFLQQFASPPLTVVAQAISLLGSEAIWVLGGVLVVVYGWQRRWRAAASLLLVAVGAQILNDVLKAAFHRTRPEPLAGFIAAQAYSFPSGHAMVGAAFYIYVTYLSWRFAHGWRRAVLVIGLCLLLVLIGLARMYLQVHYLSDVIAGYLAGFLWADAVILGGRALTRRRRRRAGGPNTDA